MSGTNSNPIVKMLLTLVGVVMLAGSAGAIDKRAAAYYYETGSYLYYDQAVEDVGRMKLTGELDKELEKECNGIIGAGQEALAMRDEGITLEVTLEDLEFSRKALEKEEGMRMRQDFYLEISRMIQTVYRNPKMDLEAYNRQFFAECIMLGGY